MMCPHGGQVTVVPSQSKVQTGGGLALLASDTTTVSGCTFTIGTKPQPCLTVQWVGEATQVKVNGQAVLLKTSSGLCKSAEGMVQGTVSISSTQTKVGGQ